MTKWILMLAGVLIGGAIVVQDVEAKRFGGGRTVGTQRNVTNAQPANPPARQAQQAAPQGQQAAPAAGWRSWVLPVLGGIAIGSLLGSMFDGGLGGLLLLALVAGAVFILFRTLARNAALQRPVQLATPGNHAFQAPAQAAFGGGAPQVSRVPAGFDVDSFLRGAKQNFLKLQMANDTARLDEIREFTTPELFEALRADALGGQQTDIASLQADLLEVVSEGDTHWASVRFSGTVRETPGATPEEFSEVWNLAKPVDGSSGWLLAGIQQMH